MPKNTIRVGQRLINWDGQHGYVALNSAGKRVYGHGERFKIEWLDADGRVEDSQYVTLEQFEKEALNAVAASCRGRYNNPHKGLVMSYQLDLSLLEKAKDPEWRDLFEGVGRLMAASNDAAPPALQAAGAKIIQFPIFPEATRPVSNDMARSALFSCVQGRERDRLEKVVLATMDGTTIEFDGEQLNQDDHDVLMQLVFMARKTPVGSWVTVSSYAVLQGLGRASGGRDHKQLQQEIERLTRSNVTLRHKDKDKDYTGHLIGECERERRHWKYRFNERIHHFFSLDNYTHIDWERRKNLKRKDLARWLQLYLTTHARPFPVSVSFLRHLSGSHATLREFRRMLKTALAVLTANYDIDCSEIDPETDLVYIDRTMVMSKSQKRHLSKKPRA